MIVSVPHMHNDCLAADVDYVSTVSSVQFETFQSRQFVPITILDDQLVEGNESFIVNLETPSFQRGVRLTSDPAQIIIRENDCKCTQQLL